MDYIVVNNINTLREKYLNLRDAHLDRSFHYMQLILDGNGTQFDELAYQSNEKIALKFDTIADNLSGNYWRRQEKYLRDIYRQSI